MPSYARILMTGASGFVGRRLAPALQAAYPAAALAAIAHSPSDTCPGWTTFCVDLADADAINEAVRSWRPDLVVHLAAQSSVGEEAELAEATWRINSVGALNLACAIARTVPESMVFNVSTGEVYGSSFLNGPASETTPLSPQSIYARSKAAAEAIFEDVLPRGSRLVTVRPLNHTGAGQDERFVLAKLRGADCADRSRTCATETAGWEHWHRTGFSRRTRRHRRLPANSRGSASAAATRRVQCGLRATSPHWRSA